MIFHWSLSDNKSPQVSRTRLRILAVLSKADVWIVSTRPPTSKSSRPFNNPLVIVPKAPITVGTIVTFMFYRFFNCLARSRYLSFFSLSFRFILCSTGTVKWTILQILFFFVDFFPCQKTRHKVWSSGRIGWSVCMLKSYRSLCESFSGTGAGLCIYHLFVWSNWNFLHFFQWITLPRPSRVSPYTPSVLICCIRLLCDWSFRLCHRIDCFVAPYLFSLWYDWFLWCCPVLLLGGIPFLS